MHNYLHMLSGRISAEKASVAVTEALGLLGLQRRNDDEIKWKDSDGNEHSVQFSKLIVEARESGFPQQLFALVDAGDPIFGSCRDTTGCV